MGWPSIKTLLKASMVVVVVTAAVVVVLIPAAAVVVVAALKHGMMVRHGELSSDPCHFL